MKTVLVIDEMPNSCDKCEVRCGGYTAKEYAEKSIKRPSWCPLRPLPEQMLWGHTADYIEGYNACLDEITGDME